MHAPAHAAHDKHVVFIQAEVVMVVCSAIRSLLATPNSTRPKLTQEHNPDPRGEAAVRAQNLFHGAEDNIKKGVQGVARPMFGSCLAHGFSCLVLAILR